MSIGVGDILLSQVSVGSINLLGDSARVYAFNIYEDIFDYFGPKAEIRVHDYADALGNSALNGSYEQDVVLSFSEHYTNSRRNMTFKMYENANLNNRAETEGSGRFKEYDIRCVMPELLNAEGNYVNRSFVDYTTNITKTVLEENLLTQRNIEIQEQSSNNRRYTFNQQHPREVLRTLTNEHIGTESRSSAFITFQKHGEGNSSYIISTFEKLFQQSPVANLVSSSTLSFSTATLDQVVNSIRRYRVDSTFFTRDRARNSTVSRSYNIGTGTLHDEANPQSFRFRILGRDPFTGQASYVNNSPSEDTMYDNVNDPLPTTVAQARAQRRRFMSYLTENHGTFEIHGNPGIKLGDVVNLTIPNHSAQGGSQERIFSGPALVVSIKHQVLPMGSQPRYTMVLGLVKAGYNQVTGGSA